ncbi:hypothetical protein [Vitiosangium sp. GDMCC 1.1324]|uniref:hypothetical protein n=1 Tax=Vitiosangium sp. (strain GDMCC 1.1324) TaxID=2138576 RepID=UPI000D37EF74|nr:hypothetical protein [Vitiosangium sp. GDMCC 1.1324]PTL84416.1 hypothetical protein DAT35_04805 [Vitiosangium sp. GDMCC 1.1324]
MPYSVWLTSHRRYEDVRAGAPDRLTLENLRTCLGLLARSRPTQEVRRPDGATWVFRGGEPPALAPLLMAGVRPNNGPRTGTIQLTVSGTSPFFMANMYELLSFAAMVNEELGLLAFEGVHGREVTVESLSQLRDVQGEYTREMAHRWQLSREQLYTAVRMPLEFPAGGQDEAPNLLALRLKHPRLPPLTKLLGSPPEGLGVEIRGEQGVWFDRASDEPVTWFHLNPHASDELLIWPQWGEAPFAKTAHSTFDAAVRLRASAGGQVLWNGEPVTPERTAWLQRYPELLGVELLQLVTLGWEPVTRQVQG